MTTISATNSAYTYNFNKSDRAEKAKKIFKTVVPVVVATAITKKALNKSGVKLVDIFKNGNASKFSKSLINVLSAPANFIQNKLSAVAPATGGSGLKATFGALAISLLTDLVSRLGAKLVDFICGKADDFLKPKN